jgi:hypothetical protein
MMNSRIKIAICLLGALILCSNAYAISPVKMIKSPINYVKELMGFKKELKDRAVEMPQVIKGSEDEKRNRFKRGYALFSEKRYRDAAIELYHFMSMSNHD